MRAGVLTSGTIVREAVTLSRKWSLGSCPCASASWSS